MKDIMLDIETMGLGENAAIIQVAAVFFDRITGETGAEFCKSIDLDDCLTCGFHKTESTEKWWKEQNQEVLQNIFDTAEPLLRVIGEFHEFITADDEIKIWSHATFDFPIVQNYFDTFELSPMNFRNARDLRTLVDLSEIDLGEYDWSDNTHNALDDCKFQIKYCVDAMNRLYVKG